MSKTKDFIAVGSFSAVTFNQSQGFCVDKHFTFPAGQQMQNRKSVDLESFGWECFLVAWGFPTFPRYKLPEPQ